MIVFGTSSFTHPVSHAQNCFANLGVARDTFSAGVDNYISPTYITGSAVYLYGDSKYKLSSSGFEAGSRFTKEFQFKTKIVEF